MPQSKTVRSVIAEMAFDTKVYFFCFLGKQLDAPLSFSYGQM